MGSSAARSHPLLGLGLGLAAFAVLAALVNIRTGDAAESAPPTTPSSATSPATTSVTSSLTSPTTEPPDPVDTSGTGAEMAVPTVGGRRLPLADPANRPPPPSQWVAGSRGVPSNSWWSSAVYGPGSNVLWTTPLSTKIDEAGTITIGNEIGSVQPDGAVLTGHVPAVFVETVGPGARTVVSGHGDFHVELTTSEPSGTNSRTLTLVRGSPIAELEASTGTIRIVVPGSSGRGRSIDPATGTARAEAASGTWVLATHPISPIETDGDAFVVTASDGPVRIALGPLPDDAPASWDAVVGRIAAHPLVSTREELTVSEHGAVRQTLRVARAGDATTPLALLDHQRDRLINAAPYLGTVKDARGRLRLVDADRLELDYDAAPVLWSVTPSDATPSNATPSDATPRDSATGASDLAEALAQDVAAEGDSSNGSYFGGKEAYRLAVLLDVAVLIDDPTADSLQRRLRDRLDRLVDGDRRTEPTLVWEPTWGSVLIEPAEFGSGDQLNDHQLQYGYWVAAASHLAEHDPQWGERHGDAIDLLLADYGGAATMPELDTALPANRTWSPYDGHSWASGTAPFGDGNNLESISETTFSSWAGARWLTVTGRSDLAEVFLARLAIEHAVADGLWLPTGPVKAAVRPWSGIVFAAKVDQNTWFSPLAEAALGIRLLPLGPASVARYRDAASIEAATRRWDWCEANGCDALWPNLLASDAVVAGRAGPQRGGEIERSTSAAIVAWWADLWRSPPAQGWRCTPGAVVRQPAQLLAANPTGESLRISCIGPSGSHTVTLNAYERTRVDLDR